mmetsp:Transcript_39473/g.113484  ORF Transcript_39473/g.113484 Transcript_39473/m.113484 type:complete len:430 (-) Transcript_39473:597-1886(-)
MGEGLRAAVPEAIAALPPLWPPPPPPPTSSALPWLRPATAVAGDRPACAMGSCGDSVRGRRKTFCTLEPVLVGEFAGMDITTFGKFAGGLLSVRPARKSPPWAPTFVDCKRRGDIRPAPAAPRGADMVVPVRAPSWCGSTAIEANADFASDAAVGLPPPRPVSGQAASPAIGDGHLPGSRPGLNIRCEDASMISIALAPDCSSSGGGTQLSCIPSLESLLTLRWSSWACNAQFIVFRIGDVAVRDGTKLRVEPLTKRTDTEPRRWTPRGPEASSTQEDGSRGGGGGPAPDLGAARAESGSPSGDVCMPAMGSPSPLGNGGIPGASAGFAWQLLLVCAAAATAGVKGSLNALRALGVSSTIVPSAFDRSGACVPRSSSGCGRPASVAEGAKTGGGAELDGAELGGAASAPHVSCLRAALSSATMEVNSLS